MSRESSDDWERYDVLRFEDGEQEVCPAGDGERVIRAHEELARKRRSIATITVGISLPVLAVIFGTVFFGNLFGSLGIGVGLGFVGAVVRFAIWDHDPYVPELVAEDVGSGVVEQRVDDFDPDEVVSATADETP